ncbi:MAG TPA: S-layer homology domain-containing protein [Chthonomonadales bacterium]|nr:S-layer homology domain-containing protein [Chthonomonadales bacterium]
MRYRVWLAALAVAAASTAACAQTRPADVPANHWAAAAVTAVVDRQVMDTPSGRFGGNQTVSRAQLITILAQFTRSLKAGRWEDKQAAGVAPATRNAAWRRQPVTRYELAVVLARMGSYTARGIPVTAPSIVGESVAIPPALRPAGTGLTAAQRADLDYLVRMRLIWSGSPFSANLRAPVTGADLSTALVQLVAGLNAQVTDEPQIREGLGPRRGPELRPPATQR